MFGTVIGGMLLEMIKPAKMLPIKRRLIELISRGLFSLIRTRGGKRGFLECKEDNSSAVGSG